MEILLAITLIIFGALLKHIWTRYRARIKTLRWSDSYHRVAVALEASTFGKVEVSHNGIPVTNLYTASIEVQNESTSDLKDVVINIACLDGSTILSSFALIEGSLNYLNWTYEYSQQLSTATGEQIDAVLARRDYHVPVLNRGAKANFFMLLQRNDTLQPKVSLGCDHLGFRVRYHAPGIMWWGVPDSQARGIGVAVTFAISVFLAGILTSKWIIGLGAWILGITVVLFGVGTVKACRALSRLLS